MEPTKEEMLDNLNEEITDIEGISKRSFMWTIGLFSGLFVVVIGMLIVVMAQKGTIAPEYGNIGFRMAITGVAFYWVIRLSNIAYRRIKKAKMNSTYERKHKASDFDEEK